MTTPKILTLDCETSPNIADVWSIWNTNVSLSQLRETTKVICFAAKWYGEKKTSFYSDYHHSHDEMVLKAWEMVNDADVVVHFNGKKFDMPHLRREFLLAGLGPHSPVQEIDLLEVVKSRFRFASNKLQHISTQLGLEGKVQHEGHSLWVKCMAGDQKAWSMMRRYNIADVVLTEQVYDRLKPWTKSPPHAGLFSGEADSCPRCGSVDLERRGFAYTRISVFQQYRCHDCGSWSRGNKAIDRVSTQAVS